MWIWEQPNWPEWEYDIRAMASQLDEVARDRTLAGRTWKMHCRVIAWV